MKKLVLSLAIISALGLSGCDSETINDVKNAVAESDNIIVASARVVFDPGADEPLLSVPNDLLFSGTTDGTLVLPVEDASDFSDPIVAMSTLDGWSTTNPFVLEIDFPDGTSLDGNSVFSPDSVKIYECEPKTLAEICTVASELTFSVDFIAQASGNSVAIIPLQPLKAKTAYIVALTNNLKDSNGKAVAGSSTYESVRQDITTHPLATDAQLGLQQVINNYENAIVVAGADQDSLIYTMSMTTQSTVDVLTTVKGFLAAPLAAGGLPPIVSIDPAIYTISQVIFPGGAPSTELDYLYSTGMYHTGSVTLPYYLGVPSIENPTAPINDWWKALCDNGVTLAGFVAAGGTLPDGPLSESDAICTAVGLRDLSTSPGFEEFDVERNLTQYSPVPAPRGESDIPWITNPGILDVQMTTPVISPITDAVRAGFGLDPLTVMPDAGWPVVILQHGITSKKEDMLAITGVLSAFGFATVAIDHPLHGSRGFDLVDENGVIGADGIDDINASTVSATHYMNLASLLTTRDNMRQSSADILGLRLGLNAVIIGDGTGDMIDGLNVHFLGHSLGAITGINFMALANSSLGNDVLDAMFAVKSNSQAMPGVMVANFLMESGAFGDVIKASLTYAASEDFQAYVTLKHPDGASETELVIAYQEFYSALTDAQQASLEGTFAEFTFAAQTVTDAGDPANYAAMMAATSTPTHLIEVVGDGGDNLSDQVIPNSVTSTPFGGTEGAIALLGLPDVSETIEDEESGVSGAVRFLFGHHGSILDPSSNDAAPDAVMTSAATAEMQGQVAQFFLSEGQSLVISDSELVQ